jgi:hypothetical protein
MALRAALRASPPCDRGAARDTIAAMRRGLGIGASAAATALVAACSSPVSTVKTRPVDASAGNDAPPDVRTVKVTFWPFWALPMNDGGFETPEPLGGVNVCVAKKRPYGAGFDAFVDVNGPCTTTIASATAKVVLGGVPGNGVPGNSELVITASRDGYQPRAFAVTTGAWDLDVTAVPETVDNYVFNLVPLGEGSSLFPHNVTEAPGLGTLIVSSNDVEANNGSFTGNSLGDAVVSVDPAKGNGPFYFYGGKWIPGSTKTVPGGVPNTGGMAMNVSAGAMFVNLPEGEYDVTVSQPNAFCGNPYGRATNAAYGYVALLNDGAPRGTLRAPVLAGYTTAVAAECGCLASHDSARCGLAKDAGL